MICHVFWFQEPHYNKKRHNCRPKATLESWAKDWWQASKKKTSATGWVSWVPWFPEADIQYKSEGKTIGKDMPRCCHTPWIKLSQKSIWEWPWEIHRNTALLRILHPRIPIQFAGKSVNALRLSCRSLTCNLRVDGTSCGMQAMGGVTWII